MSRSSPSTVRPVRTPSRANRGNTLVGIFIGLLLGLALAAAVAYFLTKSPSPFQGAVKADSGKGDLSARTSTGAGSEKPRFDFYKILPGTEEAKPIPPVEAAKAPAANIAVSAPVTAAPDNKAGDRYFLQAGAFQTQADAEDQKAKLAFLGLEASIQTVALADKGTWYRVRLGPFGSAEEMTRSKGELNKRGIDAAVIKNP
jgi:cell division protein FtsN